jgi:hypothetical protein
MEDVGTIYTLRVMILFILLVFSFSLLFLDWYNE